MSLAFPIAGYMGDRWHTRDVMQVGIVVLALSLVPFLWLGTDSTLLWISFWVLIGRIAMAMMIPGLSALMLAAVPMQKMSQGTSISNLMRQLGGVLGVGIAAISIHEGSAVYTGELFNAEHPGNEALTDYMIQMKEVLQRHGISDIFQHPMSYMQALYSAKIQGSIYAYRDAFGIIAGLILLSLIPASLMVRDNVRPDEAKPS